MTKRTLAFVTVLTICGFATRPARAATVGENPVVFPQGTWTATLSASYIPHIRFSVDELYNLDFSVGRFIWDNHSLNLELQGYWADQQFDSDVYIGGIGILGRWHLLRGDKWSIFIDGGGGVTLADQEFPQSPYDGTRFNFTGKAGLGFTYQLRDDAHLIAGARYFHLSNGNYRNRDDNPTFDGVQFWTGVMWTW